MALAVRRGSQQGSVNTASLPAMIGGINSVDAVSEMSPKDCIFLYNLVSGEYGLRSRLGSREWGTGVGTAGTGAILTLLPFTGSAVNGGNDKIFACAADGIYDVTQSGIAGSVAWQAGHAYIVGDRVLNDSGKTYLCTTAGTSAGAGGPTGTSTGIADNTVVWDYKIAPVLMVAFGIVDSKSGKGIGHTFVTAGGHFFTYCDESNGYYVYAEANGTWVKVTEASDVDWAVTTGYILGDRVNNGGLTYLCITAGTSDVGDGPIGPAADITDGTAHWQYVPTISGVNPENFVFCMSWKNRLWFVERDTARAWYLDFFSLAGEATAFNFGTKFRAGGSLVGLWNWTFGEITIDDSLVAISAGGDVVVFQGTDPATVGAFVMKGVYHVGGVPTGRRIATVIGGDLLILSMIGVVSLSKLIIGQEEDRSQYLTHKIANLFNLLVQANKSFYGWAIEVHPEDNSLVITVPSGEGIATEQLVMSLATKGWSQYRDLPIYSMASWGGKLYFGTVDGKVCINDGYIDGVTLANPDSFTPVQWSFLSSFQNLGSQRQKRITLLRPSVVSQGTAPIFQIKARYKYDFTELAAVSGASSGSNAWDTALWDAAVWGGGYGTSQKVRGGTGMGVEVAIAMRGTAVERTAFIGVDVVFTQGGFL